MSEASTSVDPSRNMHSRQRLRLSTLPDLYTIGRKPSVAPTTTSDITDEMVGLKPDALAREIAERYVRAAVAYHLKQAKKAEIVRAARRAKIIIAAEALQISVETAEGITAELVRLAASSRSAPNPLARM
jgi:hypothetical protein